MKNLVLFLALLSTGIISYAQEPVTGKIKNGDGSAVPGATVHIRGTDIYTFTDSLGQFTILPKKNGRLQLEISSVGYKLQDISLESTVGKPVEITLIADDLLENIIVTSRRRSEIAQEIPIAISVLGKKLVVPAVLLFAQCL